MNDRLPASLTECRLLIDGTWQAARGAAFPVMDKFRLAPALTAAAADRAQATAAVDAAHAAFRRGAPDPYERGMVLERAAALVEARAPAFIRAMQVEAGFTESDAAGEHRRAVQTLRLSGEEARRLAGDVIPLAGAPQQGRRLGFTLRVPLGVVAAITPFNAPINTVSHKIAPAFAAGNATVLKPSTHTPVSACLLAQALLDAGMPKGFLNIVHGGAEVAGWLLEDPRVRFFAFTGSTEVGRSIQARAGLRRTQMELGSIAFTLICDDANVEGAIPKVINAGFRKAGQVCTSVQMLLVHRARFAEVERRLTEAVKALPFGDPMDPKTVVGPLISEAAAVRVEAWVEEALAGGAQRLAGGPRAGAVIPPTLLTGVDRSMKIGCQEVFGPVVCLAPFDTLDEAIERVNATPFGLASGVFTNRLDEAFAAARRLEVGGVHVNETSSARVDLMPYGGSKDSGFGREGPHYAIREMSEERLVTFTL